jgi:preprotein translocase subunit SecD
VEILEDRTVGPSLGEDSIRRGRNSIIIGMVALVLAMGLYYRLSGLVSNLALVLNLFFVLALLSMFKATLTLPGIGGIVLTLGMAVDANVLIFERVREELRLGKTARAALDAGFSKAFLTIIDANITTLIAALVLLQFGTGPVKGFAVTLSIGIVSSLFTAIFVSRLVFDFFLARSQVKRLSI